MSNSKEGELVLNSTHDLTFCRPPASEKCIVRIGEQAIASEPTGICYAVLWE